MARTSTPTMQLLIGKVEICNGMTVIERGFNDPLTPAEITVLQAEHGEENVFDLYAIGEVKRSAEEELNRLGRKYKDRVLAACFPGRGLSRRLPTEVPGAEDRSAEYEEWLKARAKFGISPRVDARFTETAAASGTADLAAAMEKAEPGAAEDAMPSLEA